MSSLPGRSRESLPGIQVKFTLVLSIVSLFFILLLLIFWNHQILQHNRYQELADNNRIRLVDMLATRGIIRDRNGTILADSTPSYTLAVTPEDMELDRDNEIIRITELLGVNSRSVLEKYHGFADLAPYRAIPLIGNLDRGQVALFEAQRDLFPGASLLIAPRRYYPFGKTASHLFGYVGEVSWDQLKQEEFPGAREGDIVGKYALERRFDRFLRGRDGGRQVEVDAWGRELNVLGITEPQPGADMELSIDLALQMELENLFEGKRGAGVLLDIRTGEILAMASIPAFDPNEFSLRLTRERWNEIIRDPGHSLQSRAIQGLYPPGSTFKVVTAISALKEKTVSPDEELFCSGGYRFGRRVYRDWKARGHGKVDMFRAIVESCDVFFYQAGERTGIDPVAKWARILGLGKPTGIDLPGEKSGLIPSTGWKEESRNEQWFPGETLSAAIGQGYVLVTPLQMAVLYANIARRGDVKEPFLVRRIENIDGLELYRRDPFVRRELPIEDEIWDRILNALDGVVNDPKGTGRSARIKDFQVAGKTGTAQVVRLQETKTDEEDIPYEFRDHGWFVGFAPSENPVVAAAVVVEHGGHGSSSAAPIVRKLFEKYRELYPVMEGEEKTAEESDLGAG